MTTPTPISLTGRVAANLFALLSGEGGFSPRRSQQPVAAVQLTDPSAWPEVEIGGIDSALSTTARNVAFDTPALTEITAALTQKALAGSLSSSQASTYNEIAVACGVLDAVNTSLDSAVTALQATKTSLNPTP